MREPQKRETLHLSLITLCPILPGKTPKLDQRRLLWIKLPPELGRRFPELFQEALGLAPNLHLHVVDIVQIPLLAAYLPPSLHSPSSLTPAFSHF